jgi:hypothetical protein
MVKVAQGLDAAVLDNFRYPETVVDLLSPLPRPIVEVFCRCDPPVALERFRSRPRHPGHADHENPGLLLGSFVSRGQTLALRLLGPVIEVHTERPVGHRVARGEGPGGGRTAVKGAFRDITASFARRSARTAQDDRTPPRFDSSATCASEPDAK